MSPINNKGVVMDISKLPKWVQAHIREIKRERDVAIRALNEYCDNQTPSPFRIEDHVSAGEEKGSSRKVRYIQTHSVVVENEGVELRVLVRTFNPDHKEIILSWYGSGNGLGDIAFIPSSFQSAYLISKENMR